MTATQTEAKFKRKAKKKATTKKKTKKAVTPEVSSAPKEFPDGDLDDLVLSAKKEIGGVFVPDDENMHLLKVNDWIKCCPDISRIIGAQGIPCGLITQAYGKKDSGKTTFATDVLVETQRDGGIAILLDTENKYSLKRAAAMGLDVRHLIIIKAVTIEQAFDKFIAMITLIKSKEKYKDRKVCCVWDSIGATPSEAEMDESVKDFSMAAAKIIKGYLRKTLRYISDTKVAFVMINQVYTNMKAFGKKTTPYGGSGPEYHSAIILEFAQVGRIRPPGIKSPADFCGIKTIVECVKNHMAQPFKKVEVSIDWKGFVNGRAAEYAPEGYFDEKAEESD